MNDETQLPWYRVGVVWMVIGIPVVSIVVTLSIVWISIVTFDGLVVDDYYKRGLEVNRDLARDRRSHSAGLVGNLLIKEQELQLQLESQSELTWPDRLEVGFYHPTVSGKDVVVALQKVSESTYRGQLFELPQGRWNIQTGTEEWRLEAGTFYPQFKQVQLLPVPRR